MRILERYVLLQLLKLFWLLVIALTLMLGVVGFIGEASKSGLGPRQIFDILPLVILSLFPYTVPATFLLTVCVVYGRMAADNEITAVKSAGINVLSLLWPSFALAAILSACTFYLTDLIIPTARSKIEQVITLAMEDIFLDVLRTQLQFTNVERGIAISVDGVDDHRLIGPVIRYALPGGRAATITAREATLKFDLERQIVQLSLTKGNVETPGSVAAFDHERREFPLPVQIEPPKARNISIENIRREMARLCTERDNLDNKQIIATAFALSQGDFSRLSADETRRYETRRADAEERYHKLDTEVHGRLALACSCFFFALLGSPFAVLQGRRQFLTSFAMCFGPIVAIYYPVIIATMTLGKDDKLNPAIGMWLGNAGMAVAAAIILRKVLRH